MGKTWHPEHFVCTHCQEEIGSRNFFERDGQPYCEKDYHNLFSPRCYYCNGPILDVSSGAWCGGAATSAHTIFCNPLRMQVGPSEAQRGPVSCSAHTARKLWGWISNQAQCLASSTHHPRLLLWRLPEVGSPPLINEVECSPSCCVMLGKYLASLSLQFFTCTVGVTVEPVTLTTHED